MAYGLGLFGSLSGLKEEALDGAIEGGSALVGLAAAKYAVGELTDATWMPAMVKPFLPALPIAAGLFAGSYLRRFDARAASGLRAGLVGYGLWSAAKQFKMLDGVTKQLPLAGVGVTDYSGYGLPDFSADRYLAGSPQSIEELRGAPTTYETLSGEVPAAAVLQ